MRPFVCAALLMVASGCKGRNPAYCDDAQNPCALGFTCDLVAHECASSSGDDLGTADLGLDLSTPDMLLACATTCSGATPFCEAPNCVGCQTQTNPESACAALSSTTPHCLLGDDAGVGGGACVGCRTAVDCTDATKAICDTTSHACRSCVASGDCASLVCDLPFDSMHGTCVDSSKVVYVDGNRTGPACPGDGSFAHPRCKIVDGVADAKAGGKTIVHATNATYAENITLDFNVTLMGDPNATILANGNSSAVTVAGTNLKVTLFGFNVVGSNGYSVVTCSNISNNESLAVLNCTVRSGGFGVNAQNCVNLTVDSSTILTNPMGGIVVGGNATITNNFIVQNGVTAGNGSGGLKLNTDPTASISIINNTIADNNSGTGSNVGVDCTGFGSLLFANNILFNNKNGTGVNESQCPSQLYVATDDHPTGIGPNNVDLSELGTNAPGFADVNAPQDYHLKVTSPCIGVGLTSLGVPTHDIDGQPRPDPTTAKADIGADQYYP